MVALQFAGLGVLTSLAGCGGDAGSSSADDRPNVGLQTPVAGALADTLRVGTLNMSVGWRAENLVLKQLTDSAEVHAAVQELYAQFLASQPSERIRVMAKAIVAHPVDVLALQEVQVMKVNGDAPFHYLDTLLTVLDSLEGGRHWTVARQQINKVNTDVTAAGDRIVIEFWEGQVTLVRAGLTMLGQDSAVFSKLVAFPILDETFRSERGFLRTTVQGRGGAIWQLYNTHLEVELLSLFNTPQGMELNAAAWNDWQALDSGAQVVLGDLNAYGGTAGLGALTGTQSGLLDAWTVAHGAETPESWTCCIENLTDVSVGGFDRRLDYVLVRNVLAVDSLEAIALRGESVWGGDHAFVRAVLIQQR